MLVADEHEAASAEVAGEGIDDGEGEVYRNGCVDCVSTFFEDLDACVGGVVLNSDDHGVGGACWLEIGLLRLKGCRKEGEGDERCSDAGGGWAQGWLLTGLSRDI